MVSYKRWKFVNLGLNIWNVTSPHNNFTFKIKLHGVSEIKERVDIWMEVIENHDNY